MAFAGAMASYRLPEQLREIQPGSQRSMNASYNGLRYGWQSRKASGHSTPISAAAYAPTSIGP